VPVAGQKRAQQLGADRVVIYNKNASHGYRPIVGSRKI
jgi:hypothetical protein